MDLRVMGMDALRRLRPGRSSADAEPPFGRPARLLLGGYLLSAIGTGTVYPYLAIYIQQVRELGGAIAALGLAIIAIGSSAGSLAAGPPTDRFGPRAVGSVALMLQAAAYAVIGVASTVEPMLVACAVVGLGTGAFYSALTPAITQTCTPNQHRRAFAARYLMNNVGLGVGALISLAVLAHPEPGRFAILYEVNAASFLVFLALYIVALRPMASTLDAGAAEPAERFGWRGLLSNSTFIKLLVVEALLVAAGFAQIQSVIPLLLHAKLNAPPSLISLLLVLNCLGIIVFQPLVVKLFSQVPEHRLLVVLGLAWVAAFAFGGLASARGSMGVAAVVVFGIIFTVGECFYGPSFHPLVVRLAPENQVGRYSSVVWSLWGAVSFIAPPLGVLLVNSASSSLLWVLCGLLSGAAALVAIAVRPPPSPA